MDKPKMIWIAIKFAERGYAFDKVYFSDDLYGNEKYADEIWGYMEEYKDIGRIAFREKYKKYGSYLKRGGTKWKS